jgi:hypothetical protein
MVRRETSEVPFAFLPAFLPSCQKTISKGKTKLIKSDREDEKIERNAFKTKPSNNSFFFFLHEEHRIYIRNIGKKPTPQETSTSSIFEVKQAYVFL